MAKRRKTVSVRIPPYVPPRNAWRRQIHAIVRERMAELGVTYRATDELELEVRLYLAPSDILVHDVDNRLKDIIDALRGRVGGPKAVRTLMPLVLKRPADLRGHRGEVGRAKA